MTHINALVINKDGQLVNRVVMESTWTGAPGEWQPPEGCRVEEDHGQKYPVYIPPMDLAVLEAKAITALLQYVALMPDAPEEVKAFARAVKG